MKRQLVLLLLLLLSVAASGQRYQVPIRPASEGVRGDGVAASRITLPNEPGSVKFAAIGDSGRGNREQNELGAVMVQMYRSFPYEFVLLTGDNIYYGDGPQDYREKFEIPYKGLLDAGVKFYASLGNHDESNQRFYEHFNMKGNEYYRLEKQGVSFYALNSNYMDKRQLDWLIAELAKDPNTWKIAFFHHPPFSSGDRHGSDEEMRELLHPIFAKYNVSVVFNGHDHFYERIKPQDGVQYFVTGAGGKIRAGDIEKNTGLTAKGFDTDLSFMMIEIVGDKMHYQVVSRAGSTVDSGVVAVRSGETQVRTAKAGG